MGLYVPDDKYRAALEEQTRERGPLRWAATQNSLGTRWRPIRMVDGAWTIPEAPGLGVEVNETAAAKHPFEQEIFHTRHAVIADGTIVDW